MPVQLPDLITGSLTAAAQVVSAPVSGYGTARITLSGTFSATAVLEGSDDGGTTWYALQGARADTGAMESSATAGRMWVVPVGGLTHVRVRASVYASGTVVVRITPFFAPLVVGAAAGGGGGDASAANQSTEIASLASLESKTGIVTETAPATDTASSGLNGRLQRIAQRITAMIAQLPASLGIKADAASFSVALSTEQRAILAAQATEATLVAQSAKLPATLGQKAMAASMAVVLASDQAAIPVTGAGGGTQYADAAAAATPTGNSINWNDVGVQRAVSAAKPLPVNPRALAQTTDSVAAYLSPDTVLVNGVLCPVKRTVINVAASGPNQLQAAVIARRIYVLSMDIRNTTTGLSIFFTSATGGAAIYANTTNKIILAAGAKEVLAGNPYGVMETLAGQALFVDHSAAVSVTYSFAYAEAP